MSKRKGDYITVDDLINEVGKDASRFIMLNRSSDVELDFDFDNVIEKSKENPLYYVQYAYARISSVFRHLNKDLQSEINIKNFDFKYSEEEINILKKYQNGQNALMHLVKNLNLIEYLFIYMNYQHYFILFGILEQIILKKDLLTIKKRLQMKN